MMQGAKSVRDVRLVTLFTLFTLYTKLGSKKSRFGKIERVRFWMCPI